MPKCECGCGQNVKNRFISGHNTRVNNPMDNPDIKKKYLKAMSILFKDPDFLEKRKRSCNTEERKAQVSNHFKTLWEDPVYRERMKERDKIFSTDAHKEKISTIVKDRYKDPEYAKLIREAKTIANKTPTARKRKSKAMKKLYKDPDYRKQHLKWLSEGTKNINWDKRAEETSKRMIDGQACYMLSCITNPSKPQIQLWNIAQGLFPLAILNYPCIWTNRSIDIAIPHLAVAIEYDGSYWHQDDEEDRIRQESLEEQGWRFVRYLDRVPSESELLRDVFRSLRSRLNS